MTADEALAELIARYEFQRDAALTIYGMANEDTPPTVAAFSFAIRMAEDLRREL